MEAEKKGMCLLENITLDPFWFVTIVTFISGCGGTGLGAVIGALFRTESNRVTSLLLAFAGGVMCAMVCFNLLVEAIDAANEAVAGKGIWLVGLSVAAGAIVVFLLNLIIDRHTENHVPHTSEPDHPKTHDDVDELIHADHWAMHKKNHDSRIELMGAGIVMACAIALHNVPEGMTIGASFMISDHLLLGAGMMMAILIGMHNIPEGMAVAVPLISGGMGRVKAVLITACTGIPTVIGAWLGLWLGDVGALGLTLSLGFASGAMLYVVFCELLPEAVLMYRSKLPGTAFIIGMFLDVAVLFM